MTCSSLRSFHNLCVANCSTNACPCTPNAAFSFRSLKPCQELQDNGIFTQNEIFRIMCQEVANRAESCTTIVFQTTLQFMECMGLTNWPIFSCPVELSLFDNFNDVSILAATITAGVAVPTNITPPTSQYNININGVTCDTNSILTIIFASIEFLFCNIISSSLCIPGPITSAAFLTCLAAISWPVVPTPVNIQIISIPIPNISQLLGIVTNGIYVEQSPIIIVPGNYAILINTTLCSPSINFNISP